MIFGDAKRPRNIRHDLYSLLPDPVGQGPNFPKIPGQGHEQGGFAFVRVVYR